MKKKRNQRNEGDGEKESRGGSLSEAVVYIEWHEWSEIYGVSWSERPWVRLSQLQEALEESTKVEADYTTDVYLGLVAWKDAHVRLCEGIPNYSRSAYQE